LGSELVKIYVGPQRKEFTIHKELICSTFEFCRAVFQGEFKEAKEGVIYLPEDGPGGFSLFVIWVFRSTLPTLKIRNKCHVDDLYDLYFLAQKVMLPELCDRAIDRIQDLSLELDLLPDKDRVLKIYEKTPPVLGLRHFGISCITFKFLNQQVQDNIETINLSRDFFRESREICMENSDIFDCFLPVLLENQKLLDTPTDSPEDPRLRNNEDREDRCFYHHHNVDDKCYLDGKTSSSR